MPPLTACVDDACHVESGGEIVEPPAIPEDSPQLPAQTGLPQQVHVLAVAERAVKPAQAEKHFCMRVSTSTV